MLKLVLSKLVYYDNILEPLFILMGEFELNNYLY